MSVSAIPLEQELDAILASRPEAIADPFPVWRRLLESAPVHRHGPVLFVSRYEDVKSLSRNGAALSNRAQFEGSRVDAIVAGLSPEQARAHREVSAFEQNFIARSDGEIHARRRNIAHRAFSPRRVVEMTETIQSYTDELLDRLPAAEVVDLMSGLAYALPLMVIGDMLGVPAADREQIHVWSNLLGRNRGGDDPVALMRAHEALGEFRSYVEQLIAEKRRHPGTDLVSALMEAHEGDRLSEEELTAMFVVLLFAGHETTTNLIAHGLVELQRNPEQWRLLCDEPTIAEAAVEELLRWVSPVQFNGRVAVQTVELDGGRIEPGDTVFLMLAAANRDPGFFADPDRLDLRRPDARAHLALGFGPHFCLGNALARLEGAIVLGTLARRFPNLEIASETLAYRGHWKLRSLAALPVLLEGGA
jgi:cytochrome P450